MTDSEIGRPAAFPEMLASAIRGPARLSMLVFGILAALFGVVGLVQPEATLQVLSFDTLARASRPPGDYTLVFVIASSMAAVNMGAYYILVALYDLRRFFVWTVPFRVLTFCVFTSAVLRGLAPAGFIGVAAWELAGSVATGLTLAYERRRGRA